MSFDLIPYRTQAITRNKEKINGIVTTKLKAIYSLRKNENVSYISLVAAIANFILTV